jgi:ribosomal protein S18 acetylase RimI-like enzyme
MSLPIVPLHFTQTEAAAQVLGAAFSSDPLVSHFLPEDKVSQLKALQNISAAFLRYGQVHNQTYTTDGEIRGVALWLPPAEANFQMNQLTRLLTSGLLTLPLYLRWERLLSGAGIFFEEIMQRQTTEPHWYLAMLGVSPDFQSQGVGSVLLQPVLQQADQQGLACYLDTSTAAAVRFYKRQGFEVYQQQEIAPGLPYWKMKRPPSLPLETAAS